MNRRSGRTDRMVRYLIVGFLMGVGAKCINALIEAVK